MPPHTQRLKPAPAQGLPNAVKRPEPPPRAGAQLCPRTPSRHGGHRVLGEGVKATRFLTPCVLGVRPGVSGGQGGVAGLLLELSGHLLAVHEILSRPEIQQLASYRERRRRCSEAYTWVRNKSGSRYWYWYLKCPQRRPSSVYLGASPEAHRALMEAAGAAARVRRALAGLDLGGLAGQLAEAARKLEKLEAAAPAEAAQHAASTPRGRRRPRRAPADQTPAAQQ